MVSITLNRTSNLILNPKNELYIIDFGLSSLLPINHFSSAEDRAVDLYVLERAFQSTHPWMNIDNLFNSYKLKVGQVEWNKVDKKLNVVRSRGRKKVMIG